MTNYNDNETAELVAWYRGYSPSPIVIGDDTPVSRDMLRPDPIRDDWRFERSLRDSIELSGREIVAETDPRQKHEPNRVRVRVTIRRRDTAKRSDDTGCCTITSDVHCGYRGRYRLVSRRMLGFLRRKLSRMGYRADSTRHHGDSYLDQAIRESLAAGVSAFFSPEKQRKAGEKRRFGAYRAAWSTMVGIMRSRLDYSLSTSLDNESLYSLSRQVPAMESLSRESQLDIAPSVLMMLKEGRESQALRQVSESVARELIMRYAESRPSRRSISRDTESIIRSMRYGRRTADVYGKQNGEQ